MNGMSEVLDCTNYHSFPYLYTGVNYSLETISNYLLPIIEDENFVLVLNNIRNHKFLTLELITEERTSISYANQIQIIDNKSSIIQFKVNNTSEMNFFFKIENKNKIVKIKKVYLHD